MVYEIINNYNYITMNTYIPTEEKLDKVVEEAVSRAFEKFKPSDINFPEPKEVLTNREAMNFLGVSRSTLQRWRNDGKLPYSKVEGKIFYKREDLIGLLEVHRK